MLILKDTMKIRQEVFDTYWKFAEKRQDVFFKRIRNDPPPWSDDPILNTYKFCNTYRASDRVSQYLIKNVIYMGSQVEEEIIFRILLFKIFNKIETWEYLEEKLGEITLLQFNFDVYANLLQIRLNSGYPIYSNAYMSCANKAFGFDKKHLNHLTLIQKMNQNDKIAANIVRAKNLEEVFHTLRNYPLIGNFMAYQLTIDINYSEVINFSENSFTIAGPGAERGIKKCFFDTKSKSNTYIINWMTENQELQFQRLGINFQSLWGRSLHCIDCQGLFCETDKYSRVKFPELKSNRKRIKTTFQANSQKIEYFYPPKWKINDKVLESINESKSDLKGISRPRQLAFRI